MPKIEIEDESVQALLLLIVLVLLLTWAGRDARSIYRLVRLNTAGQIVEAEVIYTGTWATTVWPYRIDYRFEVDGQSYEEPRYRSRRVRDIGAPASRAVWRAAAENGTLPVLYLPANPRSNVPAGLGSWLWLYSLERVWAVAFKLTLAVLIAAGMTEGLDRLRIGDRMEGAVVVLAVVSFGGWLILLPVLRLVHLVLGFGDMDVVDLITSLIITVANIGISGVVLVSIFRGIGGD